MAVLVHGTTRQRAERIVLDGPNLDFIEPGGFPSDEFSFLIEDGRTDVVGAAEDYALKKTSNFPDEGGPAVVVVEVPDAIIDLTFDRYLPDLKG